MSEEVTREAEDWLQDDAVLGCEASVVARGRRGRLKVYCLLIF